MRIGGVVLWKTKRKMLKLHANTITLTWHWSNTPVMNDARTIFLVDRKCSDFVTFFVVRIEWYPQFRHLNKRCKSVIYRCCSGQLWPTTIAFLREFSHTFWFIYAWLRISKYTYEDWRKRNQLTLQSSSLLRWCFPPISITSYQLTVDARTRDTIENKDFLFHFRSWEIMAKLLWPLHNDIMMISRLEAAQCTHIHTHTDTHKAVSISNLKHIRWSIKWK